MGEAKVRKEKGLPPKKPRVDLNKKAFEHSWEHFKAEHQLQLTEEAELNFKRMMYWGWVYRAQYELHKRQTVAGSEAFNSILMQMMR